MTYINTKAYGTVETIDEFPNAKEAYDMLKEYRLASPGMGYYLSSRCTNDWREPS